MFDYFISHSSADKNDIVEALVDTLKNMGYSVWYDKDEIFAGDNISIEVQNGLSKSYCLILVLTSNFVKSKWTYFETGKFDAKNCGRIIPIVFDIDTAEINSIQSLLGNLKYLDANKMSNKEIVASLARTLVKAKQENTEILTLDKLIQLQKQLATYETVNSAFISICLKDYLDLIENHKDYLILSGKKIVRMVAFDLLEMVGFSSKKDENNAELADLIEKYNIANDNIREFLKYILYLNSESNNNDHFIILNRALVNILTYYIHTKYPIKPDSSQIEVGFPDELAYKDFIDMFEIDQKVMRNDLIANVETTYAWFKYNQYTHIVVRDTFSHKSIGYFSVLPITEEIYEKILTGDFQDKDFTEDVIKQYVFPDFYRVYIAAVGIDPAYQNTGAFLKLYNALIDMFISLAKEREIYISEILAEASTKQGEKFCKMVGMKKIRSTPNDTDVYRLVTIPPEFRLANHKGKELHELYKKRFDKYRDYFEK